MSTLRPRPRDVRLLRDYVGTMLDPEFRPFFALVVGLLTVGTVVYSILEDWSILNSLYFCVVTLSTIGYGDYTPTNDAAKVFTIIYIFVGVGTLGVFISAVSRASLRRSMDRRELRVAGQSAVSEDKLDDDL
jgi:hypothetical protein